MKRFALTCLVVLAVNATAHGDIVLSEGRLSVDLLAWVNSRWKQTEENGYIKRSFDFYRLGAFVGVTGRLDSVVSMRVLFDAGWAQSALDLYVDFRWPNGVGLRAGQFRLPVGFEALTELDELKFIEYSFVKRRWKPWDPRDVGLMLSHDSRFFELVGAVVNGNGRRNPFQDDNNWKDVAGRLVLRPLARYGLTFAGRSYYGRMGEDEVPFRNVAGEVLFCRGAFAAAAEVQHALQGSMERNSFYIQATYEILGLLEPAARFHMEFRPDDKFDFGVTGGLSLRMSGGRLRVMLNYDYWERRRALSSDDIAEQKLLLQLQARI